MASAPDRPVGQRSTLDRRRRRDRRPRAAMPARLVDDQRRSGATVASVGADRAGEVRAGRGRRRARRAIGLFVGEQARRAARRFGSGGDAAELDERPLVRPAATGARARPSSSCEIGRRRRSPRPAAAARRCSIRVADPAEHDADERPGTAGRAGTGGRLAKTVAMKSRRAMTKAARSVSGRLMPPAPAAALRPSRAPRPRRRWRRRRRAGRAARSTAPRSRRRRRSAP